MWAGQWGLHIYRSLFTYIGDSNRTKCGQENEGHTCICLFSRIYHSHRWCQTPAEAKTFMYATYVAAMCKRDSWKKHICCLTICRKLFCNTPAAAIGLFLCVYHPHCWCQESAESKIIYICYICKKRHTHDSPKNTYVKEKYTWDSKKPTMSLIYTDL